MIEAQMDKNSALPVYTTDMEIEFAVELFNKSRPSFLKYASIVIHDQRSWTGDGMSINVNKLKSEVNRMLRQHREDTDPIIPNGRFTSIQ